VPETRDEIVAEISARDVSGQIAVGSHNLQVVADHGAIVHVAGQPSVPRMRPTPVALRPRDIAGLIGREQELALTSSALADGITVAFVGLAGIGKTSLLRRVGQLALPALEHGVVFTRAAGQPIADLERFLFDAFYETDGPYQPTPAELRHLLADRRALVVLDDLEHERDDVSELLDSAPACVFMLASTRRCLWGEGRSVDVDGLDADAALALLVGELGRELRTEEQARAAEVCRLLGGRPLSLLHAAALAREGELPLGTPEELEQRTRDGLDDAERRVLRTLELLAPAAIHVDDVAAIAGVPDAAAVLERLKVAGVAQAHSPRWSATLSVELHVSAGPEDGVVLDRARARLAVGTERRPAEDVPVLLATLLTDVAAGRLDDVLALARAADALLTLSGRWGAWRLALEHALAAAQATGDDTAKAWALHQLGTRRGCLGEIAAGGRLLEEALALRRTLGDETGAAISAHNLAALGGGPMTNGGPENGTPPDPKPRPPRTVSLARALTIGVLALATGAGVASALAPGNDSATLTQSKAAAAATETTTVAQTVTVAGPTTTVTVPGPTTTVTVPGPTTTVTVTVPAPPPPPVIR